MRDLCVSICTLVTLCSLAATAAAIEPGTLLKEDEVELLQIKTYFEAAFMPAEIDSDGDLKVTESGFSIYVRVDGEKKLITFFSPWTLKDSVSEAKKLEFVNMLNDELIYVRFCLPRPQTLWCDYQMLYEGGITPAQIINGYRLFARVVRGAVYVKDTDDIIGSD